jgi:hypothetical protein
LFAAIFLAGRDRGGDRRLDVDPLVVILNNFTPVAF